MYSVPAQWHSLLPAHDVVYVFAVSILSRQHRINLIACFDVVQMINLVRVESQRI